MTRYQMPVGPLHVALEEPMYFKLDLEGETIKGLHISAGHVHRGMEYLVMKRNFYQNITLTERICSLCSNSHPTTFCMALEEIAGIDVPPRGHYLRVIADEIKRVASNLFNVGIMAHIIGFTSLFMHVLETREIVQDIKETLYGNRMDLGANCIGGVKYNLTADSIAYLLTRLDEVEPALAEIHTIYTHNSSILTRTRGVGVLPKQVALDQGLIGPVARASGVEYDVRAKTPYAIYPELDFTTMTRPDGDVWSRAMVRLDEAQMAIALIRQCLAQLPDGPVAIVGMPSIPAGEAVAKTEAPRGELIYYLRTNGTDMPERLKWRVPSYPNWDALPVMMRDNTVADVALIVNSIDPCISCTER